MSKTPGEAGLVSDDGQQQFPVVTACFRLDLLEERLAVQLLVTLLDVAEINLQAETQIRQQCYRFATQRINTSSVYHNNALSLELKTIPEV